MSDSGGTKRDQIAEEIKKRIDHRELRPGDRIPGLHEIQKQYGVANATAQAAVRLLKEWGLVEGRSGDGTYVLAHRPIINVMTSMTIAGQDGEQRTWKDIATDQGISVAPPPVNVADALGIDVGVPVTWWRSLLVVDGRPVQIATSYFPASVAETIPEFGRSDRLPSGSHALLERAGWPVTTKRDRVTARRADGEEATALGLTAGDTVMETLRTSLSCEGQVVEVTLIVTDSTRMHLEWEFAS